MPCPGDVIEPVKLVAAVVNPSVRHRADIAREGKWLWPQRIVQVPIHLNPLQLWTKSDADTSALGNSIFMARSSYPCALLPSNENKISHRWRTERTAKP